MGNANGELEREGEARRCGSETMLFTQGKIPLNPPLQRGTSIDPPLSQRGVGGDFDVSQVMTAS